MALIINLLLRVLILFFGLGGPALAVLLYMSGDNWECDPIEVIIPISVAYIVSIVIAAITHFLIKNFGICFLTSIGVCLFAYLLLWMIFRVNYSDPEEIAWIPVGIFVMFPTCFPMAFSASGSTVLLLRFDEIIKKGKWKKWIAT